MSLDHRQAGPRERRPIGLHDTAAPHVSLQQPLQPEHEGAQPERSIVDRSLVARSTAPFMAASRITPESGVALPSAPSGEEMGRTRNVQPTVSMKIETSRPRIIDLDQHPPQSAEQLSHVSLTTSQT
jgi:hypothetical protein